jgi:hypothetical protein
MHVPFGDDISKSPTKWAMRTNSLGDFSALYSLVSLCFLKFIFTLKQVLLLVPSCWWALPASIQKERIPETPNSPLGFINRSIQNTGCCFINIYSTGSHGLQLRDKATQNPPRYTSKTVYLKGVEPGNARYRIFISTF